MKLLENMTEPELRDLLDNCGHAILDVAQAKDVQKLLFVVLLFNDPKVAQYVSNCRRDDIVKALREAADKLEARQDVEK